MISEVVGLLSQEIRDTRGHLYTALQLAVPFNVLFAGTSTGNVQLFSWPLDGDDATPSAPFLEVALHGLPIKTMAVSLDEQLLFCADTGGAVSATAIELKVRASLARA